jgi:hypothetical protein
MVAIQRYESKYHVSGRIHEVKKRWYQAMLKKKVPARLWDYGFILGGRD